MLQDKESDDENDSDTQEQVYFFVNNLINNLNIIVQKSYNRVIHNNIFCCA